MIMFELFTSVVNFLFHFNPLWSGVLVSRAVSLTDCHLHRGMRGGVSEGWGE